MKKNKTMRLASWLLILTLLTTCIISGTFAKYVTSDEGDDTARVAKWGVTATVSGSLFGEHYSPVSSETNLNGFSVDYTGSVDSINKDANPVVGDGGNIVAPGTEAGMEPLTIKVFGTPEVAVSVELDVNTPKKKNTATKNFSDIWLAKGTYGVMADVTKTTKEDNFSGLYEKVADSESYIPATEYTAGKQYYKLIDTVDVRKATYPQTEDMPRWINGKYYPIVWNLTTIKGSDPEDVNTIGQYNTVAELKDALLATSTVETENELGEIETKSVTYNSLTDLSSMDGFGSRMISWTWPYTVDDGATVDGCDTILGNLMAYDGNSDYQVVQIGSESGETTYTGATVSTDDSGVTYASVNGDQIACLTVGFNASVTVTQID